MVIMPQRQHGADATSATEATKAPICITCDEFNVPSAQESLPLRPCIPPMAEMYWVTMLQLQW